MTSVKAFNQTLQEFLDDLKNTFPEEKAIRTLSLKFETGIVANNRLALDQLMPELTKHAQLISSRNEQLFLDPQYNVIQDIDLQRLWKSDISDNTRKAIWDYLNTLLMLGTTIMSLPQNMLSQIEVMAQNCVSEMEANNTPHDQGLLQAQQAIFNNGMFQNMFQQLSQMQEHPGNTSTNNLSLNMNNPGVTPMNTPVNKPKRKGKKK